MIVKSFEVSLILAWKSPGRRLDEISSSGLSLRGNKSGFNVRVAMAGSIPKFSPMEQSTVTGRADSRFGRETNEKISGKMKLG